MSFDYYAYLAENKACPKRANEYALASGFGDGCVVWSCQKKSQDKKLPDPKNEARKCYMKQAAELDLNLPLDLHFEPDHASLPHSTWFGIDVSFTLKSPWYSKDDRPFHVLDNPVRKDRVFGVPFMSAASWKGLLRWACRMQAGLSKHLDSHDMKMDGWKDLSWIVHLFGNEKGEQKDFRSGALVFYPTWFNKVGFEVINPHSRSRRAGTQPIYYEVVPAGTKGRLQLLYAPFPGEIENDKVKPADFIDSFINSIKALLETYGISAKRTAGWGTAKIDDKESKLWFVEGGWLHERLGVGVAAEEYQPPDEKFKKLMDKSGNPLRTLLDKSENLISKTQFRKLPAEKPCTSHQFEEFKKWYKAHGDHHKRHLKANEEDTPSLQTRELPFDKLIDALKKGKEARQGGDQ
jgi:CRISPR-associated protein Cmr2